MQENNLITLVTNLRLKILTVIISNLSSSSFSCFPNITLFNSAMIPPPGLLCVRAPTPLFCTTHVATRKKSHLRNHPCFSSPCHEKKHLGRFSKGLKRNSSRSTQTGSGVCSPRVELREVKLWRYDTWQHRQIEMLKSYPLGKCEVQIGMCDIYTDSIAIFISAVSGDHKTTISVPPLCVSFSHERLRRRVLFVQLFSYVTANRNRIRGAAKNSYGLARPALQQGLPGVNTVRDYVSLSIMTTSGGLVASFAEKVPPHQLSYA